MENTKISSSILFKRRFISGVAVAVFWVCFEKLVWIPDQISNTLFGWLLLASVGIGLVVAFTAYFPQTVWSEDETEQEVALKKFARIIFYVLIGLEVVSVIAMGISQAMNDGSPSEWVIGICVGVVGGLGIFSAIALISATNRYWIYLPLVPFFAIGVIIASVCYPQWWKKPYASFLIVVGLNFFFFAIGSFISLPLSMLFTVLPDALRNIMS